MTNLWPLREGSSNEEIPQWKRARGHCRQQCRKVPGNSDRASLANDLFRLEQEDTYLQKTKLVSNVLTHPEMRFTHMQEDMGKLAGCINTLKTNQ